MRIHDGPHDGKPQAASRLLLGRRPGAVASEERFEGPGGLLLRHTPPRIPNLQPEACRRALARPRPPRSQLHQAPLGGGLDGVAQQVRRQASQRLLVAASPQGRWELRGHRHTLALGQVAHVRQCLAQRRHHVGPLHGPHQATPLVAGQHQEVVGQPSQAVHLGQGPPQCLLPGGPFGLGGSGGIGAFQGAQRHLQVRPQRAEGRAKLVGGVVHEPGLGHHGLPHPLQHDVEQAGHLLQGAVPLRGRNPYRQHLGVDALGLGHLPGSPDHLLHRPKSLAGGAEAQRAGKPDSHQAHAAQPPPQAGQKVRHLAQGLGHHQPPVRKLGHPHVVRPRPQPGQSRALGPVGFPGVDGPPPALAVPRFVLVGLFVALREPVKLPGQLPLALPAGGSPGRRCRRAALLQPGQALGFGLAQKQRGRCHVQRRQQGHHGQGQHGRGGQRQPYGKVLPPEAGQAIHGASSSPLPSPSPGGLSSPRPAAGAR